MQWTKEEREQEIAARGNVLVTGLTCTKTEILLASLKPVCDICTEAYAVAKVEGDDACRDCAERYGVAVPN